MTDLLIALLPALPGQAWSWREVAAELSAYGHQTRIVADMTPTDVSGELDLAGAYVAHCALDLAHPPNRPPALLVAPGDAGRMLPALGFSQKAARRRIVGYVLVDGELPKAGVTDWPDAPVTYVGTRESSLAELRGWDVSTEEPAAAIRAIAERSV
jgi:hypothetical protein